MYLSYVGFRHSYAQVAELGQVIGAEGAHVGRGSYDAGLQGTQCGVGGAGYVQRLRQGELQRYPLSAHQRQLRQPHSKKSEYRYDAAILCLSVIPARLTMCPLFTSSYSSKAYSRVASSVRWPARCTRRASVSISRSATRNRVRWPALVLLRHANARMRSNNSLNLKGITR